MSSPKVSFCQARQHLRDVAIAQALQEERDGRDDPGIKDDFEGPADLKYCPILPCDALAHLRDNLSPTTRNEATTSSLEAVTADLTTTRGVASANRHVSWILSYFESQYSIRLGWTTKVFDDDQHAEREPYVFSARDLGNYYMLWVEEHPRCNCDHLRDSTGCRSGLVEKLRRFLHSVDYWDVEEPPDVGSFTADEMAGWSFLVCYATIGLIGQALESEAILKWSQDRFGDGEDTGTWC